MGVLSFPGAVLFVMLPQKARQAIPGKVRTLSFAAGRVIVYQPVLKVRFQNVVAQAVLHHPVPEGERFYLPFLRIINHELVVSAHPVGLILHLMDYLPQIPGQIQFKVNDLLFVSLACCFPP